MPDNTMAEAKRRPPTSRVRRMPSTTRRPSLTDGTVEVVSEGHWKLFPS
jgi:hypothetical protein